MSLQLLERQAWHDAVVWFDENYDHDKTTTDEFVDLTTERFMELCRERLDRLDPTWEPKAHLVWEDVHP